MKRVYILRGPSGVGKTTWTERLPDELKKETGEDVQVTVCSADHFFEGTEATVSDTGVHEHPVYNFDISKLPQAHSQCMNSFLRALKNENAVIVVDNTNERRWEYMNYELAARIAGYHVVVVEFVIETLEQLREIAARSRHGVPLSVIATKAASMEPDERAIRVPVEGLES